jgi:hypothetical protein
MHGFDSAEPLDGNDSALHHASISLFERIGNENFCIARARFRGRMARGPVAGSQGASQIEIGSACCEISAMDILSPISG